MFAIYQAPCDDRVPTALTTGSSDDNSIVVHLSVIMLGHTSALYMYQIFSKSSMT